MNTILYVLSQSKSDYFTPDEAAAFARLSLHLDLGDVAEDQCRERLAFLASVNPFFDSKECQYAFECMMNAMFRRELPPEKKSLDSFLIDRNPSLLQFLCYIGVIVAWGEGRRLISQGAIKINGETVDLDMVICRDHFDCRGQMYISVGKGLKLIVELIEDTFSA